MARIRDVSFGVGASAGTFTMPNPTVEVLDLIVAFATRDTGTGVLVAPATWYQVMEVGNANNRAVGAIKLAASSTEADPIFTSATADTWCGTMASVISANIGTPATFQTMTDVNGSLERVTTDAVHGFSTADAVWYLKRGGTNVIGLTDGSLYYVRAVDTTTLKFYTTAANASSDTSPVDLTAAGSDETHYIYKCSSAVDVSVTDVAAAAAYDSVCPTATTVANNALVFRFVGRDVTTTAYPGLANYPNEMYLDSNDSGISGGPATVSAWTVKASYGSTGTFTFHGTTSNICCAWTFGVKPAAGAPVPGYVDPAGSNGVILNPLHASSNTGFTQVWEDMVTVATTITSFGGRSITADSMAIAADFGLCPFSNAMSGTPAISANWQGYRLDRGSGTDLSTGAVLGTFMNANPRDASFDQGRLKESNLPFGLGLILQDTSGNWRGWQIGALDATPTTMGIYVFGVDADNSTTATQTSGAFASSAVRKFGFLYSAPRTATVNYWSYLVQTQTLKMVGGSASLPASIVDLNKVGNHFLFPLIQRQGSSAVLSLTPIQLGGSVASYINLDSTNIQFPQIASVAQKQVYWHGIGDGSTNTLALTYKLLAGDTIIHTNSIVSSPSKYTWAIDASSSASATYNFSGLTIIGANPVTFVNVTTFTGISMSGCGTIATTGCNLDNCTISSVPATNDSLTTNSSTVIENSTITVTSVTAGNRWCSVASPVIFENNTFVGSSTTGHAMRITSTTGSPFSFVGNTFTNFGPTAFGFHTTNDVTGDTSDWVTKADHGYTTGDPIRYMKQQGGSVNIGLTDDTTYYVRAVTSSTIAFYTTAANAIANTNRIDLTSTGAETHYINSLGAAIFNDSSGAIVINVSGDGNTPTVRNGVNASTVVNNNVNVTVTILNSAGTAIPGVEVAIFQDNAARTVVLQSTATDGNGQVATTAAQNLGAIIIRARQSTNKATFLTSQAFTSELVTTVESAHNFKNGDAVVYSKNGGTAVIGLDAGTTYYTRYNADNSLYLYDTAAHAIAGGGTGLKDLTTNGTETHVLDPIRYVAGSATGTIGATAFSAQITMITDNTATG